MKERLKQKIIEKLKPIDKQYAYPRIYTDWEKVSEANYDNWGLNTPGYGFVYIADGIDRALRDKHDLASYTITLDKNGVLLKLNVKPIRKYFELVDVDVKYAEQITDISRTICYPNIPELEVKERRDFREYWVMTYSDANIVNAFMERVMREIADNIDKAKIVPLV